MKVHTYKLPKPHDPQVFLVACLHVARNKSQVYTEQDGWKYCIITESNDAAFTTYTPRVSLKRLSDCLTITKSTYVPIRTYLKQHVITATPLCCTNAFGTTWDRFKCYMVLIREVSFSQKYFCAHLYAAGTAHQRAVLNFRVSSYVRRFNCTCLVSDPRSPLSMHAICRHRVCMGQKAIPMPYTYSHTLQETHALGIHRMHYCKCIQLQLSIQGHALHYRSNILHMVNLQPYIRQYQ